MRSDARRWLAWLAGAALLAGASSSSLAAPVQYGDFVGSSAMYLDVTESSGTDPVPPGRFGPPSVSGDDLDFDPTEFVASATDDLSDVTNVQLNFDVMAKEANGVVAGGLTSILLSESGDFSLLGSGTELTSVAAGVSMDVDILEVDGSPITPISVFASSSINRDLATDGPVVLAPWNNGLLVEFAPVLSANGVDFEFGVTKAEIVIDDQLIAISEPDSVAFIAKKDFTLEPDVFLNPAFVPEPATALLLLTALGLAARCRPR